MYATWYFSRPEVVLYYVIWWWPCLLHSMISVGVPHPYLKEMSLAAIEILYLIPWAIYLFVSSWIWNG